MGRARGGPQAADPFAAVVGQRRGVNPRQSAGWRPELDDRGQRCDLCELHSFGAAVLRDVPGDRRACLRCLADLFVVCWDCGRVEDSEDVEARGHALMDAYGFAVVPEDPLCSAHLDAAYSAAWREDHPRQSPPPATRRLPRLQR